MEGCLHGRVEVKSRKRREDRAGFEILIHSSFIYSFRLYRSRAYVWKSVVDSVAHHSTTTRQKQSKNELHLETATAIPRRTETETGGCSDRYTDTLADTIPALGT